MIILYTPNLGGYIKSRYRRYGLKNGDAISVDFSVTSGVSKPSNLMIKSKDKIIDKFHP